MKNLFYIIIISLLHNFGKAQTANEFFAIHQFNNMAAINSVTSPVEDSHAYDRIGSYFNLSHGGYYNLNNFSPIAEIEEPQHPIFNNVFGSVDSIFSEYWVGHYEHPLPSDFTSLATDSGLTTANSVIVSYNNGKAIFLTDHGFCSSTFMNNGGNISTQTEIFWANLLSWALQK
ncbi:MAG: hypothetical protein ACON4Y_01560 [Flavobacteriales bacterium]